MDAWLTEPKVGGWGECGGERLLICLHLESTLPVWALVG